MTFPNVAAAFWGWTNASQFRLITTQAVDFEAQETEAAAVVFDGVLEPMPSRKLLVRPEGQREWQWWTLWTQKVLNLGDVVRDPLNRKMRVMDVTEWNLGSDYREYSLTETFHAPAS